MKKNRWMEFKGVMVGALVILAVMMAIGYLGWFISSQYRSNIIQRQKEQMLITTVSLKNTLEETVNVYTKELKQLMALMEFNREQPQSENMKEYILQQYLKTHTEYAAQVTLRSEDGSIKWTNKENKLVEIYGVHELEEGIKLIEGKGKDGNIYFVIKGKLKNGGSLEIVLDTKAYYQKLISNIRIGTNGYVILKNQDGIIFMHPEEKQWGKNVTDDRIELYKGKDIDLASLSDMLVIQEEQQEGVCEYYSYWWKNKDLPRVKKICAFAHVNLGKDYWIVSIVTDYKEIGNPISAAFTSIIGTFGIILMIFIVCVTALSYMIIQGKKNKKEIDYLRGLNQILEDTRRGEEAIAHHQRLEIIGTMTAGIAHEFNNLLTPIMGYSDMMLSTVDKTSDMYDYANEIFEASEKAKEIIKQISGLSRKNMETVFSYIHMEKALKRVMKMVRSMCPENIQLQIESDFKGEGILGSKLQLNQVMLNLCANAFQAIGVEKKGIVKISGDIVTKAELEQRHNVKVSDIWERYIRISVTDNGCGMKKEVMGQIFNPFFTTKSYGKGTGLGLSIVENIIHEHKGYVYVESEEGIGSTFNIYIPLAEKQLLDMDKMMSKKESEALKIMVIDDNGKVLELLKCGFEKIGIAITTVINTEEARKKLAQERFDILLIEQELSADGKDNSGVCFAMSINNSYASVIKIIMTDWVVKEVIEAKQHGYIDGYIEKPISTAQVLEEIRKIESSIN